MKLYATTTATDSLKAVSKSSNEAIHIKLYNGNDYMYHLKYEAESYSPY